jgi:hypothetical protein
MPTYNVSVKASYYDDLEIEADDLDDARRKAIQSFSPCPDNLFSIDIYGLSPWDPKDQLEDIKHEEYRQREVDL